MRNKFSGFLSSFIQKIDLTEHNLLPRFLRPTATFTNTAETRHVLLITTMLLALALTMNSGVIFMGFFSSNPNSAYVLAGAEIVIIIAFFISRTRHYRSAILLSLITLSLIPIFNVVFANDHSSEALLILLIWNILTILISSAITSLRNTLLFIVIDILTILLIPIIIPAIPYKNVALPLIFNSVLSITILVFARHRNLLEKDRLSELSAVNNQLHIELKERKRVEKQLSHNALHDALTGLPNRVLFIDRLQHAMERAKRNKEYQFTVFFLDLDRFKVVNDTCGHDIGDLLLIESAKRLAKCVRSVDTIARFGGDEFVILLEDIKEPAEYQAVAERILHNLSLPSEIGGQKVFVSVSMGIVLNHDQYEQPEEMLRDADIAMYHAKSHGRAHYEVFDLAMREHVMARLEMETDLWKAIENHEFVVHYQPILETTSHHIVGFEALVRWQHPARGLLLPSEFIKIAEEIGLIVPLGYWVLEEACKQIQKWQRQYASEQPLTINVNLSARQCAQTDLVDMVASILKKTGLDPSYLKLELTESLIVEDSEATVTMLLKLREIGVQIQIDDFGTGYSSLSVLHNLPIDTLKIDRTFIQQLEGTNGGMEIVRMILSLAHSLGMKVVAEGVETDYQLSSLQSMSCEYAQGFLFAKPVNHQEVDTLLSAAFKKK